MRPQAVDGRRRRVVGQHEPRVDPGLDGQEGREALGAGRIHQAVGAALGDGRQVGEGDGAEIGGEGQGLAVEVAGRGHLAVALGVDQDHGVVGHRGQLPFHDAAGEGDHVPAGTVDLGGAAQGVGVLDGMVGRAVAGHDLRARQQTAEIGRAPPLAGMGTEGVELGPVGGVGAEEPLDGDGAGHVGGGGQPVEVGQGQAEVGQHALGAVEERQALLGLQHHRLEPGAGQPVGARQPPAVGVDDLPRPGEDRPHMGQGRQVTGGAEAPEFGHHRSEAGREEGDQPVDQHRPGAGEAGGQRPSPEQHHRPDDLPLHRVAHAGGVAEHQRELEAPGLGRRHLHRGQGPETGGDAVDRRAPGHDPLHHRPGRRHAGGRGRTVEGHDRPAGRAWRWRHGRFPAPEGRPVSRSSARWPRPGRPRRWRRGRPSPARSARRAPCGATTGAAASATG